MIPIGLLGRLLYPLSPHYGFLLGIFALGYIAPQVTEKMCDLVPCHIAIDFLPTQLEFATTKKNKDIRGYSLSLAEYNIVPTIYCSCLPRDIF